MSTTYGAVKDRDGTVYNIEKYASSVKIERKTGEPILTLDDPEQIKQLIVAFMAAASDVWYLPDGYWGF